VADIAIIEDASNHEIAEWLHGRLTGALQNGKAGQLFQQAGSSGDPQHLATLQQIARGSFTDALDHILLVAAVIAFVCSVLSFVLIRQKDFVQYGAPEAAPAT